MPLNSSIANTRGSFLGRGTDRISNTLIIVDTDKLAVLLSTLFILSGCATEIPEQSIVTQEPTQVESLQTTQESEVQKEQEEAIEKIETKLEIKPEAIQKSVETSAPVFDLGGIPAYSGSPYVAVNGNVPYFTQSDYTTAPFETFSQLDSLGRCGVAYANVCIDIMPTEDRGSIGSVKPSGWQTIRYENVEGKHLYNRCHLIGFQLSGENANERNLITGTRYMNVDGMLPFENMVDDYVEETHNHVLYRVTPVFEGDNLLASGVLMEARSVEDKGDGICFNVYCYNVQPGIEIKYATGESKSEDGSAPYGSSAVVTTQKQKTANTVSEAVETSYIGNKNTKKFHYSDCRSVKQMSEHNKDYMNCTRDDAIVRGYVSCKNCNP